MLLYAIFYFACIVIAGRKYWQEEQSSLGFIAGALLGPVGVVIVYYMPGILSNSFVTNRVGKYDNSLNAADLLSFTGVYEDQNRLEEIKKRQVGAGFQVSKVYMPVTNGCFIAMLTPVAMFFIAFVFRFLVHPEPASFRNSYRFQSYIFDFSLFPLFFVLVISVLIIFVHAAVIFIR